MTSIADTLAAGGHLTIAGAPEGFDAFVLGALVRERRGDLLVVARDEMRMARVRDGLAFVAPDLKAWTIPAWDCLPYDRASPNPGVLSRRIATLSRLAATPAGDAPRVILTTIAAVLQRVPPRTALANASLRIAAGDRRDPTDVAAFLTRHDYQRAETVMEPGEFAVRGGLIDVFPAGIGTPVRLDFFGDEIEGLRTFDAASQRTQRRIGAVVVRPVSEVVLDTESVARFRTGYRALFGAVSADDPLYAAVSEGQRHPGMEHWLPLFHDGLETLFDYLPSAAVILDSQVDEAVDARLDQIAEYYAARLDSRAASAAAGPYNPVPPDTLYVTDAEWRAALDSRPVGRLSRFAAAGGAESAIDAGGRPGMDFAEARRNPDVNVFDALRDRIEGHREANRRVIVAAVSRGSRDRLTKVMTDHGLPSTVPAENWAAVEAAATMISVAVLPLERGFVAPDLAVVTEQDILGDRMTRRARRRVRAETFITEAAALTTGDLVVHVDHGISRYEGLETIEADGAPHDCLRLVYANDDKLFLPVENIDAISRYGSETAGVQLDRLGGVAWQGRRARMKARIREMADELIRIAAQRSLRRTEEMTTPTGLFDEFCARFPYTETDDQARAIADVLADLSAGTPADRLVCGDVGFGKTEVALRGAFVVAMAGRQVAVVVPTTLLCRQHYLTLQQRFAGYPVRIAQVSRLVPPAEVKAVKTGLADGTVDVVVGTHALLAKDVRFRDLALLVVDEEQHFGVSHKERLKNLKADVHVLTLTATPIPRTLQMALTGVREMSLIATPPVDRLAVRTFALPFDPVVIREALMRERFRGGQSFYVCPRIEDLDGVAETLGELVPELKIVRAHGRMAARDLETAITAFYDGAYDILLSTNIIESGLDMPAVNTIVIHRADLFGLAQLYQLRGRVGRSKARAYAYLTLPPRRKLTTAAVRRLEVMQALDSLGAGFTLASHDLDIRGAGNLLGEEQSGHIREVGIELYQQMLEEAVAEARGDPEGEAAGEAWSPQIAIGLGVMIPEAYVADLNVRLGLYRRLANLVTAEEIDAFAAELIDRFGPLPAEVDNLLQVVGIKQQCRTAFVERIEAGPKGAVVTFRAAAFPDPQGLVGYITSQRGTAKLRPDQRLVVKRAWERPADRLLGVRRLVTDLADVATGKKKRREPEAHRRGGSRG